MSDLQTALLVIGAVIIVAVFAYNKWQEARYRNNAERSFAIRHVDALVGDRATPGEPESPATVPQPDEPDVPRMEPQFSGTNFSQQREIENVGEERRGALCAAVTGMA